MGIRFANREVVFLILSAIAAFAVMVVAVDLLYISRYNGSVALTQNINNLDEVSLSGSKEVWRGSSIECGKPHFYSLPYCQATETRVYTVPGSVKKLESAFTTKFKQQRWVYVTDGDFGYFNRGNRTSIVAEANPFKGADTKDKAIGGRDEHLSVSIIAKTPTANQEVGNTGFSYKDQATKRQFDSAIKSGGKIYIATSVTDYRTWF